MRNLVFDFSGGKNDALVLDVETRYLSDEISGGWNSVDQFMVAVVVTWDEKHGFRTWHEEDVVRLLQESDNFNPIVTFNGENFDFRVLSAYGRVEALYTKSLDMLRDVSKRLGFRVKLESLARATVGRGKSATGTESVGWWRTGDPALRQKVVAYCTQDVELTRDIYVFGKEKGYVLIDDSKSGDIRRVDVFW